MGQRLNIEILENGKVLANSYYHWAGFTSSSLGLVSKIKENIKSNYNNSKNYAIMLLESTGASLEHKDRNDGLIETTEEKIKQTQYWAEQTVKIHIDTKKIELDLYHEMDDCDLEDEEIIEVDQDFFITDFDNIDSVNKSIYELLEDSKYYFNYKNKNYCFVA